MTWIQQYQFMNDMTTWAARGYTHQYVVSHDRLYQCFAASAKTSPEAPLIELGDEFHSVEDAIAACERHNEDHSH